MRTIMITGVAGFIGNRIAEILLKEAKRVIGLDTYQRNQKDKLRDWRMQRLDNYPDFCYFPVDIQNKDALKSVFQQNNIDAIIHMAARTGVRNSLLYPERYCNANIIGFLNVLELCRIHRIPKVVLASTSSLYAGEKGPFTEDLPVNKPLSIYTASKKAAETLAYTYHFLYQLDVSILRYFTVYGPAGRPDMAVFKFIKGIMEGSQIEIFGDGSQQRDFTFVDDIARGTVLALKPIGYDIVNLGNNHPHRIIDLIQLIEKFTGQKANCAFNGFNQADMKITWANIQKAQTLLGWQPEVDLEEGIKRTVAWTKSQWSWIRG